MSKILLAAVVGGVVGIGLGAAVARAENAKPRLRADALPAVLAEHEAPPALVSVHLEGRAASEKEAPPPPSDCPMVDGFVPCWCGNLGLPTSCTPSEYAESVQIYGQPRRFVAVRPDAWSTTVEYGSE